MTDKLFKASQDEEAITASIEDLLRDKIGMSGGWLSFSDYMNYVLYEPEFGYYNNRSEKFGIRGDFITAPELSPVFAKAISNELIPMLSEMKNPKIIEFGAGSGILAKNILKNLLEHKSLDIEYKILEVSAVLRERQKKNLNKYRSMISWLDNLPSQPFEGVILANEVLDAMPVNRFVKKKNRVLPLGVCKVNDGFDWMVGDEDQELAMKVKSIESSVGYQLPENYTSEISYNISAWIRSISELINKGALLIIDYGMSEKDYYSPERKDGTLICHHRHKNNYNPFSYLGLQDISCWVNFTACAEVAYESGLEVSSYTNQSNFLIDNIAKDSLDNKSFSSYDYLTSQAIKKLILPGEMGEFFKLMLLTKNLESPSISGRSFITRL